MTDDKPANQEESKDARGPRRLLRFPDRAILGGVCAGLGRYTKIDPVIWRVVFGALVFLGGAGIVLYVLAWLMIPTPTEASIVERALEGRGDRPAQVIGIALVAIGAIVLIDRVDVLWSSEWLWALVLLVLGAALLAGSRREGSAGASPSGGRAVESPAAVSERGEDVPEEAEAPRRTRGPSPGVLTLGLLLLGFGGLSLLSAAGVPIPWDVALAGAVILCGAVAVWASLASRPVWGTITIGVVTALLAATVAVVDLELRGGVGERMVAPTRSADLEDTYTQAIGRLEIDLREVPLPRGRTDLEARLGMGELVVLVAPGVRIEAKGSAGMGEAVVLGREASGIGIDAGERQSGPGARTLDLDAHVGMGKVEIVTGP